MQDFKKIFNQGVAIWLFKTSWNLTEFLLYFKTYFVNQPLLGGTVL